MKTIFEPAIRRELIERVNQLTPKAQRVFGTMRPDQALHHINGALRLYVGEISVPYGTNPFLTALGKLFTFSPIPIPRGKAQTVPVLMAKETYDLEQEKQHFPSLLEAVAVQQTKTDWPVHPFFGKLSAKQYGKLGYKHTNHHLQQFGV
ncbi:MAG TPA: DUF1569 domain-containing protein [Candidatus Kapabacteria bacterium]